MTTKTFLKKIIPNRLIIFVKTNLLRMKNLATSSTWPIRKIINHKIRKYFPPSIPKNEDDLVMIHLGGGNQDNKKFINIDAEAFPNIHYVQDVEDLSILPSNYADLIYASHVLEHISHLKIEKVLREWTRVLKKGGILKLAVPNFDGLIKTYQESGNNLNYIINGLMGGQTYEFNFHKSVFNEKYLWELLTKAGLQNIRHWDGKKDNYGFEDFAKNFRNGLNLEAEKQ